ncbi:hypothetical protein [Clostridium tagluense]|uniref:BIG2 domain-containing protein n=1 Tax=Clostridium tagluense TaxID=360422 RepID=A0A401ULQ6_9CLOT|nr:hypothetical protein [Clostridium tagluense]GCD10464.1 hypothetical protein Ctaglu_20870 [Clostridium tagluense]
MFDDTIVKILGNSYANAPLKSIECDVQDHTSTIDKEDYSYKCSKLLFVDSIEPLISENFYLKIENKIYKIIKADTYSDHMEVYLFYCDFKDVMINDVDKKVLIEETTEQIATLDEKLILSNFEIRTGDLVEFQSHKWIITSQISKDGNAIEYRGRMRKCNNNLRYKAIVDGTDRVISIPAIIDKGTLSLTEGKYFNTVDNELSCQVGYTMINKIKYIKVGFEFILNGTVWSVLGIDNVSSIIFDEQGIIYIRLRSTLSNQGDNFELGLPHNETTPVITTSIGDDFTIELPTYNTEIIQNKKFQIMAICKNNNTIVTSPTLNYNVTDYTICKVDATGLVTGIKEGATTIIINYMGEEVTLNVTITVASIEPVITYKIVAVQGSDVNYINYGSPKTWRMIDKKGIDVVDKTFTFALEQSDKNPTITPQKLLASFTIISDVRYKMIANDSNIKGYLNLVATCNENGVIAIKQIEIKGAMDY